MEIAQLIKKQKEYFTKNRTKEISYRLKALERLEQAILYYKKEIEEALYQDLKKSPFEGYMTEVGMTLSELRYIKSHLKRWDKKKKVLTPLSQFPAKSYCIREPYGTVLIIAPWNYPFLLSIEPLIGAIAAGNCVVIKPSEYASATSSIIKKIIKKAFKEFYVTCVEGGVTVSQRLLEERFDYIFYTGGSTVGKIVLRKAAEHLTPVTLELGGKSPCIVDKTADISLAAKRIVFGKFLNCGQTCVAPDYVFVDQEVKEQLIKELKKQIHRMYGENPLESADYPAIINRKQYDRLVSFLKEGEILNKNQGGQRKEDFCNSETRQIAPVLLGEIEQNAMIMKEEIFGPILPILSYKYLKEAVSYIRKGEKPLAFYFFTKELKTARTIMKQVSFGGGCINDTIIHLASSRLPFGGIGSSGMGNYHGYYSYQTFSHEKAIVEKSSFFDLPVRYPPYKKEKEWIMRKFL